MTTTKIPTPRRSLIYTLSEILIAKILATSRGGVNIRATAIPNLTNYMQDVVRMEQAGKDVFETVLRSLMGSSDASFWPRCTKERCPNQW